MPVKEKNKALKVFLFFRIKISVKNKILRKNIMAYVKKRVYRKGRKNAKTSAPKKFGYVKRRGNLVTDIKKLKKTVNSMKKSVEVKRSIELNVASYSVGQVNANNTGALCIYAPVSTADGVDIVNRVGSKVRLIGYSIRGQIAQMSALVTPMRILVEVWKTDDVVTSPVGNHLPYIFNADSISGVIDINSTRVPQYMKVYKRVYGKNYYLAPDNYSGLTQIKDFKIFIKQQQNLEFVGTSSTAPSNVCYLITVRCSTGNNSTGTASTLPNIVNTAVNTGCYFRAVSNMFFTDM